MFDFPIVLDESLDIPLYRQLANQIQDAILNGILHEGQLIPSSRALSLNLGISRFTVNQCLDVLSSLGYIEVSNRSRCRVIRRIPAELTEPIENTDSEENAGRKHKISDFAQRLQKPGLWDCHLPPHHLPLKKWQKAVRTYLRADNQQLSEYKVEPLGALRLRVALADYLARARSIKCDPGQIVVSSGTLPLVDMIARLFLDPGDQTIVEEPGFPGAKFIFEACGAKVIPVSVDENGICTNELANISESVQLIYVTPSHQDPTGGVLSAARRYELLDWADKRDALIIEDDFDHTYRYETKPLPALQALDRANSVIYVGGLWKVLFPALRLGYAVFPESLIPLVQLFKENMEIDLPILEQLALTDFIKDGALERHIRKMNTVYSQIRRTLIDLLIKHFGDNFWTPKESGGTHILARFRLKVSDETILKAAEISEIPMSKINAYYVGEPVEKEFVITFSHLEKDHLPKAVARFAAAILQGS